MALPTVDDLRAHLRLVTTAQTQALQDALLDAVAAVEDYIRQPIEAREVTMIVTPPDYGWRTTGLTLPFAPISGTVTVEDATGAEVGIDQYTTNFARGILNAAAGVAFTEGPYVVRATVGLSNRPDYVQGAERVMRRAILLWAADFYLRRNPAAIYEGAGGGIATTYAPGATEAVPAPIRVLLNPYRRVLV